MSERPTPADIAAIEARLAAATPGPWEWDGDAEPWQRHRLWAPKSCAEVIVPGFDGEGVEAMAASDADAALIANTPTDLAALLAEVRGLWEDRVAIADRANRIVFDACDRLDAHAAPGVTLTERIDGLARERDEARHELADRTSAAILALSAIAKLCGCAEWEYPGQVVRDVDALVKERDEAHAAGFRAGIEAAAKVCDHEEEGGRNDGDTPWEQSAKFCAMTIRALDEAREQGNADRDSDVARQRATWMEMVDAAHAKGRAEGIAAGKSEERAKAWAHLRALARAKAPPSETPHGTLIRLAIYDAAADAIERGDHYLEKA